METKNNHVVRRYGFHYRYDTEEERRTLSALWELVCLKMNFLTSTIKPVGWTSDRAGRRKRIYDAPQPPLERLLKAGVLSDRQTADLIEKRDAINPARLSREIARLQCILAGLAKAKTLELVAKAEEVNQRRLILT